MIQNQEYRNLHLQLCALDLSGGKLLDLSKSQLEQLANKGWSRASMQAQAILNFAFDGNYRRPAMFPDEIQERPLWEESDEASEQDLVINVSVQPNPVREELQLSYELPEGINQGTLLIVDAMGRICHQQILNSELQKLSLATSSWAAGTYFVQIQTKGHKSITISFVVLK